MDLKSSSLKKELIGAPGKAWARGTDDIDNLKPCNGTRRVSTPAWQSWPAARSESCVAGKYWGNPGHEA